MMPVNCFSKTKLSRPFKFIGNYSGSIYFLHAFVISIFVGLFGDGLWPVIGVLAISIPILIDMLTKKYGIKWFRILFLGDTK